MIGNLVRYIYAILIYTFIMFLLGLKILIYIRNNIPESDGYVIIGIILCIIITKFFFMVLDYIKNNPYKKNMDF